MKWGTVLAPKRIVLIVRADQEFIGPRPSSLSSCLSSKDRRKKADAIPFKVPTSRPPSHPVHPSMR